MFNPKTEVFQKLSELDGVSVSQSSQNEFKTLPALTFRMDGNASTYDLENEISKQDVRFTIDIFANDSVTASKVLANAEAKMRELKYRLNNAIDVPQPDGSLFHINASFDGIR